MSAATKKTVTVDLAELKMLEPASGHGGFAAYCSTFGNVDRSGDVVEKGAFAPEVLETFVIDGFIALNHDWTDIGIGTVSKAVVDNVGLYIEAEFHSHGEAQRVRVWMAERLHRGKTVKMSFGFNIAEQKARAGGGFSITRIDEVYEATVANVPVNTGAGVVALKSLTLKSALGDRVYEYMTLASLRSLDEALWWKIYDVLCYRSDDALLDEQITDLETALTEFQVIALKVIRAIMSGKSTETREVAAKSLKTLMDGVETKALKAGRKLSKTSRNRISQHIEPLQKAAEDLQSFLDETDADGEEEEKEEEKGKSATTRTLPADGLPSDSQLRDQTLRIQSRITKLIN